MGCHICDSWIVKLRFVLIFVPLTERSRSGLQYADGYGILKACKILTRILIFSIRDPGLPIFYIFGAYDFQIAQTELLIRAATAI